MAFAHGSNDVANAIGPLAAIYGVIESGGMIGAKSALPVWVLLVGGGGIVFGLVTYGAQSDCHSGHRYYTANPITWLC